MRPDVALAFDRHGRRRARRRGRAAHHVSAFRTDAEQARLFAAHPDPKWVAPPGHVAAPARHRARPRAAGGLRLAGGQRRALPLRPALRVGAVALRLHAERRARPSARVTAAAATARRGRRCRPSCPTRFAPALARAAQRWSVSARAAGRAAATRSRASTRSRGLGAGAQGIAQFMPATAAALRPAPTRSTPSAAIDAQAHLMRDLLRALRRRSRSRWPPTTPARRASRACVLRPADPRDRRPTSPTSSACCTARATRRATARARWRCGSCAEPTTSSASPSA